MSSTEAGLHPKIVIIKFNYKYYIFGEKYFEPAN